MDVKALLREITSEKRYRDQIVHVRELPAREAKYAEPLDPDPFDVTALEVLLRNVEIRKGYRFDPRTEGGRVIELPRAALQAGEIAKDAEFFSFGTNDLTQTGMGLSRDDYVKFSKDYEDRKIFKAPLTAGPTPGGRVAATRSMTTMTMGWLMS